MRHHFAKHCLISTLLLFLCDQTISQDIELFKNIPVKILRSRIRQENQSQIERNLYMSVSSLVLSTIIIKLGLSYETLLTTPEHQNSPKKESEIEIDRRIYSNILHTIQMNTIDITFKIANGIFLPKDISLKSSYISQAQSYFNLSIYNLNFANESTIATDTINQYISNNTEGRIDKIFFKPLKTGTKTMLVNVPHFCARWERPFLESATKNAIFNTRSKKFMVKMMSNTGFVEYGVIPALDSKFIRLPFTDPQYYMMIVLPNGIRALDDVLHSFIARDKDIDVEYEANLTYVNYKIPKMKFKYVLNVKKVLSKTGLAYLFTDKADFSNMLNDTHLKISKVIQAAEIEINEKGINVDTEEGSRAIPSVPKTFPKPINFIVNRPFLFIIAKKSALLPLFVTAVHNPKEN